MYLAKTEYCAIFWVVVITRMVLGEKDCSTSTGFNDDNHEYFEIKYNERLRGPKILTDITEAVLYWNPEKMLDMPTCYELSKAELQFVKYEEGKSKDDVWEKVMSEPEVAGERIRWTMDLIPCLKYDFRINLSKRNNGDGNNEYNRYSLSLIHI